MRFKKVNVYIFLALVTILCATTTPGFSQVVFKAGKHVPQVEQWIKHAFDHDKNPPFSFVYDGRPSESFIRSWTYQARKQTVVESDKIFYVFTYTNPQDGMQVECDVTGYPKFNSVEWVLHFKNTGSADSKTLQKVQAIDLTLRYSKPGSFKINDLEGSQISSTDFQPREFYLKKGQPLMMAPEDGRSSQGKYLPFFCISSPHGNGFILSIGWTGTWQACLCAQNDHEINLKGGQKRLHLYLHPSESIRTPSINLMFWEGKEYLDGTNKFRHLIMTHNSRKINGKTATYPFSTGFNYHEPKPIQEYSCLTKKYAIAMIRRNYRFGIHPEVFWLDAGWHQDAADYQYGRNWANTTGNWTVDTVRFGKTLRPIADEIHRHGAKFMVWFEPERVVDGTQWAVEHYDWMLRYPKGGNWLLFDLSNPKACNWLCKDYGDMIEDNGIDYYRQDCNIKPDKYWEANDEKGREGLKEAKYVEGLYHFWDYLLQRFPHLLIDNCASGGMRIDWETIRRSAPLWQSDYYHYYAPEGLQTQNYGLNTFLPFHGTGVVSTDPYAARSSYNSAMVCHWKLTTKKTNLQDVHRCIEEYQQVRPYYLEDYYPLTGCNQAASTGTWLAYQFNRESDSTGIIMAFRRPKCLDNEIQVRLRGLHKNSDYEIYNVDTRATKILSGRYLSEGYILKLESPRTSLLLEYKEVKKSH